MSSGTEDSSRLLRLIEVASAISAQKDYPSLFRMVVTEAMATLAAEGGTLYLYDDRLHTLEAVVVINNPLSITHSISSFLPGKTSGLFNVILPRQKTKSDTIAGTCWQQGNLAVVSDIKGKDGGGEYDLRGVISFDQKHGYDTRNIVAVPLKARDGSVLGVVQMVNARSDLIGHDNLSYIMAVAGSMGMALEISLLLKGTEDLLFSVVSMIYNEIDLSSATTGGQWSGGTELAVPFVEELANDPESPFPDAGIDARQIMAMKIAAELHDVGKIATPDYVLDKSRKLEGVFDQICLVKERFARRACELRIGILEEALRSAGAAVPERQPDAESDDCEFVGRVNIGGESLSSDDIDRLHAIARRPVGDATLLSEDELERLRVRRGTLTEGERRIMQDHAAISIELLEEMPWPDFLQDVPDIAG
ncbi:MAG: GAF domain-containing protein, partial [Betaproteobacteria bacterium]|nr:GAF domain-containing protein [Betaproteobacteria bacterium]